MKKVPKSNTCSQDKLQDKLQDKQDKLCLFLSNLSFIDKNFIEHLFAKKYTFPTTSTRIKKNKISFFTNFYRTTIKNFLLCLVCLPLCLTLCLVRNPRTILTPSFLRQERQKNNPNHLPKAKPPILKNPYFTHF